MQNMYLSLARQDAGALTKALLERPKLSPDAQWATFVRNHDELTLDKLTESERQEVFAAFGPEPEMQVYGRGLVRRLPPMLDGDPRRIRMVYSLLFSLPGTPVLFFGEEIGMGENPDIPGRSAVRTPMQWTDGKNGGFSNVAPGRLIAPIPGDGYAPEHVNVQRQRNDPDSLLQFVRHLVRRYRASPEIGWGELELFNTDDDRVFAHGVRSTLGRMIALHNFTSAPVRTRFDLGDIDPGTTLLDLHGPDRIPLEDSGQLEFELAPYGFRWLRVSPPGDSRIG